jgi:hypothetical protein
MHGRKKKSPIGKPGLNLFSEENRGDRCDYALLQAPTIIEKSNVGYHRNAYFWATLISLLTIRYVCAASSRAQSKGRIIHDFVDRRSCTTRSAGAAVAKQHDCQLPQHIRKYPCYPSGSSSNNEVNEYT